MRLPNLKKSEQIIIFALIMLTFGFLLSRFVIYPEIKRIKSARLQADFWDGMMSMESIATQRYNSLNDKVQQLEVALTQKEQYLFDKDEADEFIRLLPQLATKTDNILTAINLNDTGETPLPEMAVNEAGQSFIPMPTQLSIRGNYSNIIRFFEQLQANKQLMTVNMLNMETAEDLTEVDVELTLNLYVYEHQEE